MRLLLGLVIALVTPCALHAAVIEIAPRATAVLDMDFSPVDFPVALDEPVVELPKRQEPYLIQVDVTIRVRDLLPGQVGFSNTAFDVDIHDDGTVFSGLDAWTPANPTLPAILGACPPETESTFWHFNSDTAVPNDLEAIVLGIVPRWLCSPGWDPRYTIGQDEDGELAGNIFVLLPASKSAQFFAEIIATSGGTTFDDQLNQSTLNNTAIGGSTSTFVIVPEPSGIVLLAIGVATYLLVRQRS